MTRPVLVLLLLIAAVPAHAQNIITTVAGNGSIGFSGDGGPATSASLALPNGVAVDNSGNIYVVDALNGRIRKVDSSGMIRTFAGNGLPLFSGDGGPASAAGMALTATAPHLGVAADSSGNVYISDNGDNRVRKVDANGVITTVAGKGSLGQSGFSGDGGPAVNADLRSPTGLAIDKAGNLYIADAGNGRIRKVDTAGNITTVAGRGNGTGAGDGVPALDAELANPTDIAVDDAGNLYIADFGSNAIRKVDTSGVIRTILHGGFGNCQPGTRPAASADVGAAIALALDRAGNLYIADHSASCVHRLDSAGNVTTYAGGGANLNADNIPATSAGLGQVSGVAVDASGNLYLVDNNYAKIRKVTAPPANPPTITAALNGASFASTQSLTPGGLASLFGTGMAAASAEATNIPLPLSLGGVSVTVRGIPAPLLFVSPTQINFQAPWAAAFGAADIVVTWNGASSKFAATISGVSPGIFTTQYGAGQAIAINADGSLAAPAGSLPGIATRPAKPGETIIILATGLGLVTPAATTGAASSDTLRRTILTPTVLIGGTAAEVAFSGLSPQFVGVNQLNVTVPNVAAGTVPLQIDLAGVRTSDKVTIAVGN